MKLKSQKLNITKTSNYLTKLYFNFAFSSFTQYATQYSISISSSIPVHIKIQMITSIQATHR